LIKKEYLYVSLVIILVIALAVLVGSRSPRIDTVYPETRLHLLAEDFAVATDKGQIVVGETNWEETRTIFPAGERLGGSTVYHPDNLPVYLTFSEDEDILTAVHIYGEGAATHRGIDLTDSPARVVEQYGPNYVRFSIKNSDLADYDMLYGENDGNTVIFQVRGHSLSKIIIQHSLADQS